MIREKGPFCTQLFQGFGWRISPITNEDAEEYGFYGLDERPVTSEYQWIASDGEYSIILTENADPPDVVEGWEFEPWNPDREWIGDDETGYKISAIKKKYKAGDHECWVYCAVS